MEEMQGIELDHHHDGLLSQTFIPPDGFLRVELPFFLHLLFIDAVLFAIAFSSSTTHPLRERRLARVVVVDAVAAVVVIIF